MHPLLLLLASVLSVIGLFVARAGARAGISLLFATSFAMLVFSVASTLYAARYAIPAQGLLVAAGALGAWQIVTRVQQGRRPSSPAVG